jgi:arylsulfatase
MISLSGLTEDPAIIVQHLEEIGGPNSYNHYPVGWAWAMNTPFQWGKQIASHFGGTRNPLVVSWPKRIKSAGTLRQQFHHVIDIVPTILEAAGISEPYMVNGVPQKPIEGISMVYSFDNANAKEQRHTQYFEMFGNRAIYNDGWIAACRHGRLPWENAGSFDFDKDTWELYKLDEDFSEYNDVAAKYPEKLRELREIFWMEAVKHNVLPLDDRFIERADPSLRPSLIEGRTEFAYYPGAVRIPESSAPNTKNKSHTITVNLENPREGCNGVLVAEGGIVGGFTLYVKEGRPTYEYNWFTQERYKVTGSQKLPIGACAIRIDFDYDGGGIGKGGNVSLFVNDKKVAAGRVEKTEIARFSADETFDVGMDTGSPVSTDYESPNPFTGTIKSVRIELRASKLSSDEEQQVKVLNQKAALAAH